MRLLSFEDFVSILFRGADAVYANAYGGYDYIFRSHSRDSLGELIMHYTHVGNRYSEELSKSLYGTIDILKRDEEYIIRVNMRGDLLENNAMDAHERHMRIKAYRKLFTRTGGNVIERNLMELLGLKYSRVWNVTTRDIGFVRVRTRCSTGKFKFEREVFGILLRVLKTNGYEMDSGRTSSMELEFRAHDVNDRKRLLKSLS